MKSLNLNVGGRKLLVLCKSGLPSLFASFFAHSNNNEDKQSNDQSKKKQIHGQHAQRCAHLLVPCF